jgi:hypothetical protein
MQSCFELTIRPRGLIPCDSKISISEMPIRDFKSLDVVDTVLCSPSLFAETSTVQSQSTTVPDIGNATDSCERICEPARDDARAYQ